MAVGGDSIPPWVLRPGIHRPCSTTRVASRPQPLDDIGMRPRHLIYSDLLRFQADLSLDLELSFFQMSAEWHRAKTVLDLGSGNG